MDETENLISSHPTPLYNGEGGNVEIREDGSNHGNHEKELENVLVDGKLRGNKSEHEMRMSTLYTQNQGIFSGVVHLGVIICLGVNIAYKVAAIPPEEDLDNGLVVGGWSVIGLCALLILYLLVWAELYMSRDFKGLRATRTPEDTQNYLRNLQMKTGKLLMSVENFNWTRGWKNTGYSDHNGQLQYRMEYISRHNVTGQASMECPLSGMVDTSPATPQFDKPTRLILGTAYTFGDSSSEQSFENIKKDFCWKNHTDVHQTYTEELLIPDLQPYVLVTPTSVWYSSFAFIASTALLLSWPYRWYIWCTTDKVTYTIVKQIKVNSI